MWFILVLMMGFVNPVECSRDMDCPSIDECRVGVCISGTCGFSAVCV